MNGMSYKALTVLGTVLAGAVSGLLSLGLYGALRERKWKTWSAGAMTGALGGLIGGIGLWAMSSRFNTENPVTGLTMDPMNGLGQITIGNLPMTVTGLTMSRLSGMQVNGLSMHDLPLGSYAVNPRNMQLMGVYGN